jgi:hypothetical protein
MNDMKDIEGKIAEWLSAIGIDKALHFLLYAWIVAVGLSYSFTIGVWCFLAMLALSILKELAMDKQVDWVDIIAGVAGGIASFALYIPKDWLL